MRVSAASSSRAWGSCLASSPRGARMKRPKAASAGSPGSRSRIVREQLVLEGLKAPVDEVLLGGEVVEDRLLGHLGGAGDLRHRDALEAALAEQRAARSRR